MQKKTADDRGDTGSTCLCPTVFSNHLFALILVLYILCNSTEWYVQKKMEHHAVYEHNLRKLLLNNGL